MSNAPVVNMDAEAQAAFNRVAASAEQSKKENIAYSSTEGNIGPGTPIYITKAHTPGKDVSAQGDLYLLPIEVSMLKFTNEGQKCSYSFPRAVAKTPTGKSKKSEVEMITINFTLRDKPMTQLVPGETEGAKHCLQNADCIEKMYVPDNWGFDSLYGPIFMLKKDRAGVVTHPKHGWAHIEPGMCVFSYYQQERDKLLKQERRNAD